MRDAAITLLHAGHARLRAGCAALLFTAACALGGCANSGATSGASGAFAMASAGSGATVAFEQIDGPPPQVFDLAIVSREGTAAYRVRAYLSAQVVRGKTMIAWVWDVYDGDQQRALRLSGQEPAGKSGRDPWGSADDLVLRKIAQAGLSGLSGMINGTPQQDAPPPAPSQDKRGPAVASAAEHTPAGSNVAALSYTDH
jgi:hypothetical protein